MIKTFALLRALGPVDLKNLRRDALLAWIPVIPLLLALVLRLGASAAETLLRARYGFDLAPYEPLIASVYLLMAPTVVGMVLGFLLLDERDDRVLAALLVTPLPLRAYLAYRLAVPSLLAFAVTLVGLPIVGLRTASPPALLLAALLAALACPMTALFLAAFAENKVAGFALVKFVNTVALIPLVAYLLPLPWQVAAGVVPTYWPLRLAWPGLATGGLVAFFVAGAVVNLLALWLLVRRFTVVVHQ